ncbi:MAG: phage major tail protein, TP901-1 family [Pseudomonadota bacterium]
MSAHPGKDMLLKIAESDGTFTTVAGLRTKRFTLNAQSVDITDGDSVGRWRELMSGTGQRRAALSASGIFKDKASDARMREVFFDAAINEWKFTIPDFGEIVGSFQITSLEYAGTHDGEVTFDIAMESASQLTFEAAT